MTRAAEKSFSAPFSHNGHGKRGGRRAVITGGAGFIGTNIADQLLSRGERVVIVDTLIRPGVEDNARWLYRKHGSQVDFALEDVRDAEAIRPIVRQASKVYHFAAQVAVTTSLDDPLDDFETNARGTLNVLEALRERSDPPPMLLTSTNKVYGNLCGVPLRRNGPRYEPADEGLARFGVSERCPLDFHSPYGCSKGYADQITLDYARCFGLPTVVFRMSCIYGIHQHGTEDQGWVAHFVLQALRGRPVTLYGDGCQVRDILFADDLADAMLLALDRIDLTRGEAFNIGGGVANTTSLLELIRMIGELRRERVGARFRNWRMGDQRYYASDYRKFQDITGWAPRIDVREGVKRLYEWLASRSQIVATTPSSNRLPAAAK